VAAGTQPDYTKQWDEYLQRAGEFALRGKGARFCFYSNERSVMIV